MDEQQTPKPSEPDVIQVRAVEEGEKVYFDWQQPGARTMCDGLQIIRDNRLARQMDWGRAELEVPLIDLHFLKKKYPDLGAIDSETKTRAWKKFVASAESLPYRVRNRGRFLGRSVGGL